MKNIIILGTPRAGKTTLSHKIVMKYHYQIIQTDSIRNALRDTFPELKINSETALKSEKFYEMIKNLFEISIRREKGIFPFLIEGTDLQCEKCKKDFPKENNLIYVLGQTLKDPQEMANDIKKYDTEIEWSYGLSKEDILEKCQKYKIRSEKQKMECKQYGLKFYDTSYHREEVFEEIMQDLKKELGR